MGPTGPLRSIGGQVWRTTTGAGEVVVKVGAGTVDEAEGLGRLSRIAGAPPVPDVLAVQPDLVVMRWVEQGPRTPAHDQSLGRMLATLHSAPWPEWGGGSSWVGACPVDPAVWPDGTSFFRARLVGLASRCGLERGATSVAGRLGELLPSHGPALVHGDLWWGNVLWGSDGRPWLIDPSVHGGHPEEDLAMLDLFGSVPDATIRAYTEVRPLADGWEDRVGLFQLIPLLVHTILFGGGYRSQAESVFRRFL